MKLALGHEARTSDGCPLDLADVVMHPRSRTLTHVVLEPRDDPHHAWLVPLDRVHESNETLSANFTLADFARFPYVEQAEYKHIGNRPVAEPGWAVGIEKVLAFPFDYGIELSDEWFVGGYNVEWDRIPADEVEVRRNSPVRSSDGYVVGRVDGFACDADDHVTHLILRRGHFLGAKDVVIPIASAKEIRNGMVALTLTRELISDLPGVRLHPWPGSHE